MDKRWMCFVVLVAFCAAIVKATPYNVDEDYNYDNMFDDTEEWSKLMYDDFENNLNNAEQRADDNIYVRPEDGGEDIGDGFPEPKDYVAAFDDVGENVQLSENFETNIDEMANVNSNEEEIPSNFELKNKVNTNDDVENDQEDNIDEPQINFNQKEDRSSDEAIREELNSSSEDSANKIFEEIQEALAENADTFNANLDDDYQVEDNRSQVQNKFDEANEDGEENIPDLDENFDNQKGIADVVNHDLDETRVNRVILENTLQEINDGDNSDANESKDENDGLESDIESDKEIKYLMKPSVLNDDLTIDNKQESLDDNHDNDNQNDEIDNDNQDSNAVPADFAQEKAQENKLMANDADDNEEVIPEAVHDDKSSENKYGENIESRYNDNSEEDKNISDDSQEINKERDMIENSFVDESVDSEEDIVNKVYEDLKSDLTELFDTLDKLTENDSEQNSEEQENIESNDDQKTNDDNTSVFAEAEIKSLIPEKDSQEDESTDESNQDFVDSGEERILRTRQDYYDSMKDYEEQEQNVNLLEEKVQIEAIDTNPNENEQNEEVEESDNEGLADETENEDNVKNKKFPSDLDSLLLKDSEEQRHEKIIQQFVESLYPTSEEDKESKEIEDAEINNSEENNKEETEDLSSAEINNRMTQFAIDHADDLNIDSEDFDRDVAPIYLTLKVGEPVLIESPNYPEAYPANNIVDWILDGEGMGIEMNVTDLAVNGIIGDYLLVKPGGIDESGTDGLIFSYQLRTERRYRFLDVNRMFVRFQSQPGMSLAGNRGFRMSVQLLQPLAEAQVPIPEPEAIIQPPQHTLQVFLAGLTPRQFTNQSEDFRMIVADMATLFINSMVVEADVNATEVAQITQVATCNVNWPGFELCAGVSFGVPLADDADDEESGLTEEQLRHMWTSYVGLDPFAARLRRMGVTEFAIPNDRTTLFVWLVIGFGVAISAGMLALALWRWSCFEEYTRMPAFSDTDSVISDRKRDLDLYPTPHQTLPPLYDDDFIKYEDTARVDMGGFANKSYVREGDLFDLDSDDDLGPVKRDRSSNIQPKDIYQV